MKLARTCQWRTAQLAGIVPFVALLCGTSLASAMPFPGAAGSLTVTGPSVMANTGPDTIKDDRAYYGSLGLIGDSPASALEPASMLLFVGGLISIAGFLGVDRRVTNRFED